MQALKDWGYTTITPSYLRQVLVYGGDLPSRPVIITFDDGDMDVYMNALPVMRAYGFIGAFYVVSGSLGAEGYVGVDQLAEFVADGWEIGSHTINHIDLTANHDSLRNELLQSRLDIQTALSITVTSIAYPYGLVDAYVATKAQDYGYQTGMGLGIFVEHTLGSIYYLCRREVHGDMDLDAFADLLPWSGEYIPPTTSPSEVISTTPGILMTPALTPTLNPDSP
jgi:peptidoglycan/xylan/chitin deacetylase (PgdA/CDA1 family)